MLLALALLALSFALLLALPGCAASVENPAESVLVQAGQAEEPEEPVKEEPVALHIAAVGDVIVHMAQVEAQYNAETDGYDFTNNFQYVRQYIESADLALCNLETTFAGLPYTGYPLFSAPDEMAPALRNAGFDVATFANNHVADKGVAGMRRTLEVLHTNGLVSTGVRTAPTAPRYAVVEVKGVKIGIVAYTYASSTSAGDPLINGMPISAEAAALINYFRYAHLDEDLEEIGKTVAQARAEGGADIVILYYHWGEEYQLKANAWHRTIAEKTVQDMDVDIIFGTHPHTLQEMAFLTREGTGQPVPVFFSMGNFISNQREETLGNRYLEIGIIAQVDVLYDKEEKEIKSIQMRAVPTWVDKYLSGGRNVYAIIPLDEQLDDNSTLAASGHLTRAKRALEDANGILGIE